MREKPPSEVGVELRGRSSVLLVFFSARICDVSSLR
jgi:hypothetical protein